MSEDQHTNGVDIAETQYYSRQQQQQDILAEVKKDVLLYYNELSDFDKQQILDTWNRVWAAKSKFYKTLENSFFSDEEIMKDEFTKRMLERVQISLIVDAYNTIVSEVVVEHENETAKNEAFEKTFEFLMGIGKIHKQLDIDKHELLLARTHLIKSLKKSIGASWTIATTRSWYKLTNFVQIGIMSAFKLDREPILRPSQDAFEIARNTWRVVQANFDAALTVLWKELTAQNEEMIGFFNTPESLAPLLGFSRLLNLSHDCDSLIETLKALGKNHVKLEVQRRHFKMLNKAWFVMLKAVLGIQYSVTVSKSWKRVFLFISQVMMDSLEDEWMMQMPSDPDDIKLHVTINAINHINPADLTFKADVVIQASNGNQATNTNVWIAKKSHKGKKITLRRRSTINRENKLDHSHDNAASSSASSSSSSSSSSISSTHYHSDSVMTGKKHSVKWNLQISNAMATNELFRQSKRKTMAVSADESFYQRMHQVGTFAQLFQMQRFPFDQHKLKLKLRLHCSAACAKIDTNNVYVIMGKLSNEQDSLSYGGTDWDVFQPYAHVFKQKLSKSGPSGAASYEYHCDIIIPIARKWRSKLYQVLIPLMLIDIIGLCVYWIEPIPIFYRMTTLVSLLMTLLAFKWSVSQSLPSVPYLTHLDYHFNISYFFLFVHCSVNGLFIQYGHKANYYSRWLDRITAAIVSALFLLIKLKVSQVGWSYIKNQHSFHASNNKGYQHLLTLTENMQEIHFERQKTLNAANTKLSKNKYKAKR